MACGLAARLADSWPAPRLARCSPLPAPAQAAPGAPAAAPRRPPARLATVPRALPSRAIRPALLPGCADSIDAPAAPAAQLDRIAPALAGGLRPPHKL